MPPPLFWIDAFADEPFQGNPAAVCLLEAPASEGWMQAVATEIGLSETAFLVQEDEEAFGLRWFTPTMEVDLCGHATLASAHALWESGRLGPEQPVRFLTRSGLLTASRAEGLIWLDFPNTPPSPTEPPEGLVKALGVTPRTVSRSRFDVLAELDTAEAVRTLQPDLPALARIDARGVIVTAPADAPGIDFVSRFFAPAAGVPEDPVTGSAHCALGPYWAGRLGRTSLTGYQASSRGGGVQVRVDGKRVHLGGRAVTFLLGTLLTPPA